MCQHHPLIVFLPDFVPAWGWSQSGLAALAVFQNISLGLFGPGFLDVTRAAGGSDAAAEAGGVERELKTKPSMWLVVWTEARVRTEGGGDAGAEQKECRGRRGGGLSSSLSGALWWGQEDLWGPSPPAPSMMWVPFCVPVCVCVCGASVRLCSLFIPVRAALAECIIAPLRVWTHIPFRVIRHVWTLSQVMACPPLGKKTTTKKSSHCRERLIWITLYSWRFNYVIESMKSPITILSLHFIYCPSSQMDMERARLPVSLTFSAFLA